MRVRVVKNIIFDRYEVQKYGNCSWVMIWSGYSKERAIEKAEEVFNAGGTEKLLWERGE